MPTVKKIEDNIINNSSSRKVNVAETDFLEPYFPADDHYAEESNLLSYMRACGKDVYMIHDFLNCKKALQQREP